MDPLQVRKQRVNNRGRDAKRWVCFGRKPERYDRERCDALTFVSPRYFERPKESETQQAPVAAGWPVGERAHGVSEDADATERLPATQCMPRLR